MAKPISVRKEIAMLMNILRQEKKKSYNDDQSSFYSHISNEFVSTNDEYLAMAYNSVVYKQKLKWI